MSKKPGARQADTSLRIPVPHSYEFALAIFPAPSYPPWLRKLLSSYFGHILGLTLVVMIAAALGGWIWVAFGALLVSISFDWLGCRMFVQQAMLINRMGMPYYMRQIIRSLLILTTVIVAGQSQFTLGFVMATAALLLLQLAAWSAAGWLSLKQPMLRYNPNGKQSADAIAYAKIYAPAAWPSLRVVLFEAAIALWYALAVAMQLNYLVALSGAAAISVILLGFLCHYLLQVRHLGATKTTKRIERDIIAELEKLHPTSVLYSSADAGAPYILNQWISTLERLPEPCLLLVREATYLAPIPATNMPVIFALSTRNVETAIVPSIHVAYYLANSGKNVHLLREARLHHVFLNHGDSDKSTSANPVVRVYNGVWVAGQAAVERYRAAGVDLPGSVFEIIGRPQVEGLKVGSLAADQPKTLLYAPTFEGFYEESNYSSLERMGADMIAQILQNYPNVRIIFKPHPATGIQRAQMLKARARVVELLADGNHIYVDAASNLSLHDCFDAADVLLSDISSVVTDFLYTDRPVLTTNPRDLTLPDFKATFPTQAASYIVAADLSNLDAVMGDALGADSMRAERVAVKKYVLGDLPDGPTSAFIAAAERAQAKAKAHAATIVNEFRVK